MPPLIYGTITILGLFIMVLSFLFGDDSNFNIRYLCFAVAFLFLAWWMNKYDSNRGHKMYRGHPPVSPNPSRVVPQT